MSLLLVVRTSRQKFRNAEDVNNAINQLDLFTIYRPILTKTECTWNTYQDRPHSETESKIQIEND